MSGANDEGHDVSELKPARLRPLYPRWVNGTVRAALGLGVLGVLTLPAGFIAWARTPYATGANDPKAQPLLFDHRHHTRDVGIDCPYCHDSVERSSRASVPSTEVCMSCHAQVWGQAPALAAVRASYFSGQPIHWQQVSTLPDYVFFDHSAHVNRNVGCESCHGRVDLMGQVFMPNAMTMTWCLDCHKSPERALRPTDRITDMEWSPTPDAQAALGKSLAAEHHIVPPTTCSTCHR